MAWFWAHAFVAETCSPEQVESMLVGSPSIGLDEGGKAQANEVVKALAEHARQLNTFSLPKRMRTLIGGDGVVIAGGLETKHSTHRRRRQN